MAIYTIVDEGYDVTIRHSLSGVLSYLGGGQYLDYEREVCLTKSALSRALKEHGEARIYNDLCSDWYYKVQRQTP